MLNFREQLSRVKNEKMKAEGIYSIAVESILRRLIQYFEKKDVFTILKGEKIRFSYVENTVYVKVYIKDTLYNKPILTYSLEGVKDADAKLTLIYLEQKFKEEGYELIDDKSVIIDGYFEIFIKP